MFQSVNLVKITSISYRLNIDDLMVLLMFSLGEAHLVSQFSMHLVCFLQYDPLLWFASQVPWLV